MIDFTDFDLKDFNLRKRDQQIAMLRIGLGCPSHTFREIAEIFGVSTVRVRQIFERTRRKICQSLLPTPHQ